MFSVTNFPAIQNTWLDTQSYQVRNTVDLPQLKILPDSTVETQSAPFMITARSFNFSGVYNYVGRIGMNISAGGGAFDAARPMVVWEFEQNYLTAGQQYSEVHGAHRSPVNAYTQRFFSAFLSNTQAWTRDNNQLMFAVGQIFQRDPTGTTNYFLSDGTGGFRTIDLPIGTDHTSNSAGHLLLSGPSGMSSGVRFIKVLKNSNELLFTTRYGETKIDGTASGAGTGELNSMFEVNGRAGTSGVMRVRAEDGTTNRLYINAGTGAFAVMQTNSQWQHSGPMTIYDTNGSTKRFQCNEAGTLQFSAISAASGLGSISAVLALQNTSGTQYYAALSTSFIP